MLFHLFDVMHFMAQTRRLKCAKCYRMDQITVD